MRVGVLGGTFDPIHYAHLHLAERAQKLLDLERIFFVVAPVPPHKSRTDLTVAAHRFAMVTRALEGYPALCASTIELENPGEPFTAVTLPALCARHGLDPKNVYFIAGGDSLKYFSTWKDWEQLLSGPYHFVFVQRPGIELTELGLPKAFASCFRTSIQQGDREGHYLLEIGAPDISATAIRERVAQGADISKLVPPEITQYIRKYQLYRRCYE